MICPLQETFLSTAPTAIMSRYHNSHESSGDYYRFPARPLPVNITRGSRDSTRNCPIAQRDTHTSPNHESEADRQQTTRKRIAVAVCQDVAVFTLSPVELDVLTGCHLSVHVVARGRSNAAVMLELEVVSAVKMPVQIQTHASS